MNPTLQRPIALTPSQLRAFADDGYVVVPGVFCPDEVAEMTAAFERLAAEARTLAGTCVHRGSQFVIGRDDQGHQRIDRVVWCGAAEPALLAYGADVRLLSMAAQILRSREMDQLINQGHYKYAGDGVAFPWHQDSTHRRYGTDEWTDVNGDGSFVETLIALDPMREDNGPLRFVPGSHRGGHIPLPGDEWILPEDRFDADRAVTLILEPGDVALFGPYTVHGSWPNTSDRPRRAFLNGYAAPGANRRVYPGEGSGRRLRAP